MQRHNILNKHQRFLLDKLDLREVGDFYMAGGTALALQIGHRTSVDFDFYSKSTFDSLELLKMLQSQIGKLEVQTQQEKTLRVFSENTELSFFAYPYPLIRSTVPFERFQLAAKEDIAAMKLIAIVQRGTQRDFVDIFFLLREFTLEQLIAFVRQKYGEYQEQLLLRALVYFEDAENESAGREVRVFDPEYSWGSAKDYLIEQVKKYQSGTIKP